LFGCTEQEKTITFEEGLAQINMINTKYAITHLDSIDWMGENSPTNLTEYKTELIQFKANLNEYAVSKDTPALNLTADIFVATADLLLHFDSAPRETLNKLMDATANNQFDSNLVCTNETKLNELDTFLTGTSEKTLALIEKIDFLKSDYPTESALLNLNQIKYADITHPYILGYSKEAHLVQKVCTIATTVKDLGNQFTALTEDSEICARIADVNSLEEQLIEKLDEMTLISNKLISVSETFDLGNVAEQKEYVAQFEVMKQTILEADEQLRIACVE
jgi:hypothetical protein